MSLRRSTTSVIILQVVLFIACVDVPFARARTIPVDYSEYDAILALDESLLSQIADGWHGGVTIDNAVADEDGDASIGADLRYRSGGRESSSRLQVVDQEIYRALLQYSHPLYETAATHWRGIVGAGYGNDVFVYNGFNTGLENKSEDKDIDASLALAVEHDFESVRVSSQLQTRWRRFERVGDGTVLDQSAALDVEKDFRSLAWNIAAQWQFDTVDQYVWLQATRVTDMDVSACLDDICLAADRAEENFTLYDATLNQEWFLTVNRRDGVSLLTQLSGYTASVDHLPVNYQFSIGGMYSLRGYDEGIAGGDEMALWRNELRLPWHSSLAWMAGQRQHIYAFYDWGMVRQHAVDVAVDGQSFELLPAASPRLCSAGVGLDLAVGGDISLRLEYAVAQAAIDGLVDRGDTRVHTSLDWRGF